MVSKSIINDIKKAVDSVSKMSIEAISFGGSRARYDDNIGANTIEDLDRMLRTNPEFKKWYLNLQKRARDESDIQTKRELELRLMYPLESYKNTVAGKVKSDWEGRKGTIRDSDMNRESEDDADYTSMGGNATDNYMSDAQKYALFQKGIERSNSYSYTLPSEGSKSTKYIDQDPAENIMTSNIMTKLVREANKSRDPNVMVLLIGLLIRWGINLPTYVVKKDVPKEWWRMVKWANDNGGISRVVKNMRTFLHEFGLKRYGNDIPQMRELRQILMKITDSKTTNDLFQTMMSTNVPAPINDAGKAKDYFDIEATRRRRGINESVSSTSLVIRMLNNHINESLPVEMEAKFMHHLLNLEW